MGWQGRLANMSAGSGNRRGEFVLYYHCARKPYKINSPTIPTMLDPNLSDQIPGGPNPTLTLTLNSN